MQNNKSLDSNILVLGITDVELTDRISEKVFQKIKPLFSEKEDTEYITRHETANLLRISLPTLRKWTVSGKIRSYRIGTSIRYKKAEIESSMTEVPSLKYRRGQ